MRRTSVESGRLEIVASVRRQFYLWAGAYLRWLDKHDRAAGEEAPIGLLLCAGADSEQVKLMDLESAGIRVAEYLARIPDMKILQRQLHKAVEYARAERGLLASTQDNGEAKQ